MDITNEVKQLQKIIPNAVITAHMEEKCIKYECDLRHTKITPEQHDSLFKPIKNLFGSRLMERYSHCTGHFDVFVRYPKDPKRLN